MWWVYRSGIAVLVLVISLGLDLVAGFVRYEASGTFSVSSGPDPDGLDGAEFELVLVIDDLAVPAGAGPVSASYETFVSASLSVLSGPSQGVFPVDTLILSDNAPFFLVLNFDGVAFRSNSFGLDFLSISFFFSEDEWGGVAPDSPVGATPPFLDVGASIGDTFYLLFSPVIEVQSFASLDADLEIQKTGGLSAGGITYELLVTNNGPFGATGVVVTDALPPGVEFVGDTCDGANVPPWTWNAGSLSSGESLMCSLSVSLLPGTVGLVMNTASVTANEPDLSQENNDSVLEVFVSPAQGVPALGAAGVAFLLALLVGAGCWRLRRL